MCGNNYGHSIERSKTRRTTQIRNAFCTYNTNSKMHLTLKEMRLRESHYIVTTYVK